jgi:hypothetical protein
MPTTQDDIREWLKEAYAKGCSHMVVACDTYDHTDFPVYVMPNQSVQKVIKEHSDYDKMQRVMEVYTMRLPMEEQLAEHRAYHID